MPSFGLENNLNLEPLRKGVIAKMTYLVEFWLILESDLVERAPHKIFDEMI